MMTMTMTVPYRSEGRERSPDIPDGVAFRVVQDNADGTCLVEILSDNWPPRTYKSDIWRRATEQEAEAIEQMLANQSARIRGLWYDSSYILHTDELFQLAWDNAVQAFGEERAGELLAPSEG